MCDFPVNICACGAEPGYIHAQDCPFPLYRGDKKIVDKWYDERKKLQDKLRRTVFPNPQTFNPGHNIPRGRDNE